MAAILLLSGCATPAPEPDALIGGSVETVPELAPPRFGELPGGEPFARLRARARSQADTPAAVESAPAWLPESEHVSAEAMAAAAAPLEAVLRPIREAPLFADAPPPPPSASVEDRARAVRLYARGRLARSDGNTSEALTAFETASRLDPSSPEVWRALADAQLAAGLRSSGFRSFQTAAERGLDDVRAWALIGLEAVRRRDIDNGVRWLVAARDGLEASADPIAVSWIEVSLGELLLSRGRQRAGAELLQSALERAIDESSRSAFQSEYATLVRRRPQLWLTAGDAWALVGDWSAAADAYEHAAAESTGELAATVSRRRTAVLIASGRTAEAALALLDRVRRAEGRVGEEDLQTLERLGPREPDIADAIAELAAALAPLPPSVRGRLLLARLVSASEPIAPEAIDRDLMLTAEHMVALLKPIPSVRERWDLAERLVVRRATDADAVADALFAGGLISGPELVDLASGGDLLSLRVRLRLGLPLRTPQPFDESDGPEVRIARVATATRLGRWDEAFALAEPLVAGGGMDAVRALAAGGRTELAFEVWQRDCRDSADIETLLIGAGLATEIGRPSNATPLLLRAHALDPGDDRVYERMLTLLGTPGELARRSEIEEAIRTLRTHAPDSMVAETLEVAQILQRGYTAEAESRARQLIDRMAAPDQGDYAALLALWSGADERGDVAMLESAQRWLEDGLDPQRPAESRAITLAHLIALRDTPVRGLETLRRFSLAQTPARVHAEAELMERAGLDDEARGMLRAFYDHETLWTGDALRLALVELEEHGRMDASLDMLAATPTDIRIGPDEMSAVMAVCNALMTRLIGRQPDPEAAPAIGLQYAQVVAFAVDRGAALPEPYHRVRLRALAQASSTPMVRLVQATGQMHRGVGRLSDEVFGEVFTLLLQAGRTQDALLWAVETALLDEELDERRWPAVAVPLASMGTMATTAAAFDLIEASGKLVRAVEILSPETPDRPSPPTDLRAELAYLFAGIASARDRNAQAAELYRFALRLEPEHPWACNDYGYLLADRGEDLDEAERLLEIAYRALPDRTSVIDSVGWLRYKQGRFVDPEEGALVLLERAAASLDGAQNPTILDHLGDARWMVGDPEGAAEAWRRAEQRFLSQVRELNTPDLRALPVYSRLQAKLGLLRDKLRLAEIEGGRPPVARSLGERIIRDE